jgi:hypothetical protein
MSRRRQKIRWQNVVSTLPRYERLLAGVRRLDEPVRTSELQKFAGLADQNGTLGALFMLEAEGLTYPERGIRRQYLWHPGERPGERPAKLPSLLPYERVPKLLRHFGQTAIGTAPIMHDVHFVPVGAEKHGRRERMLGALKILAVLGVAAYDDAKSGWYHARAGVAHPYVPGLFGPREGDPVQFVSFDDNLGEPE